MKITVSAKTPVAVLLLLFFSSNRFLFFFFVGFSFVPLLHVKCVVSLLRKNSMEEVKC